MKLIQNAKYLFSSFLFVCFFTVMFTSCKKEINDPVTEPTDESQSPEYKYEQAYPGIKGEFLKTKFNGVDITLEKKMGRYVWMGDIAFEQKTFDSLRKAETDESRTFKPTVNNHWWRGEVFFTIQAGFTAAEQTMINDAINHWRNNTSLRFTQRTNQPNFIQIVRGAAGSGLFSDFVGMKGGLQIINLQGGGFITGNIIHEIGHAIGFYHEQSRADRDNAIQINWNNLIPGTEFQFQTYIQQGNPGAQIGVFDFGSVMLYGSFAFSNNTLPTITRLDGTTFTGQRIGLSGGDIEASNYIYGPPFAKITQMLVSESDDGQNSYWTFEQYINFYSDPACTQPITLTTTKTIEGIYHTSEYSIGQGDVYYSTPINKVLNPGSHSYYIGGTEGEQHVDGSYNLLFSRIRETIFEGAFLR